MRLEPGTFGTIGLSEMQIDLLDIATSFCREKSPIETVRALVDDAAGYDRAVWDEIAGLGWLGIAIPETHGGAGLTLAEAVPVIEQMGRNLMAGPFLATTLAAQAILTGGTDVQQQDMLPRIINGRIATLALMEADADWDPEQIRATARREGDMIALSGIKTFVSDAASADWIIASVSLDEAPALVIIDRQELPAGALRREVLVDETRRSYELCLDGIMLAETALMETGKARACLRHVDLAAALLLSAEMCGGTQSVIDYTIDYLNTRKQFGKLIGAFQSLKHTTVDAFIAYEKARSHLYSAAHCFSEQGRGEIAVRMAKAQAESAYAFAADRAIQFHGGFGFTYDCDAQFYRRRAIWSAAQHGDAAWHRAKLADLLF